jgi:hypothetical protein
MTWLGGPDLSAWAPRLMRADSHLDSAGARGRRCQSQSPFLCRGTEPWLPRTSHLVSARDVTVVPCPPPPALPPASLNPCSCALQEDQFYVLNRI